MLISCWMRDLDQPRERRLPQRRHLLCKCRRVACSKFLSAPRSGTQHRLIAAACIGAAFSMDASPLPAGEMEQAALPDTQSIGTNKTALPITRVDKGVNPDRSKNQHQMVSNLHR